MSNNQRIFWIALATINAWLATHAILEHNHHTWAIGFQVAMTISCSLWALAPWED